MKIIRILYLSLFLFPALEFSVAQEKDRSWYMVDLKESELEESDRHILDSILKIYHASQNDSVRLACLNYLSETLSEEAIWVQYSKLIINYKSHDYNHFVTKIRATAYNNIGLVEFNTGDKKAAIEHYRLSIKLDSSVMNYQGLAGSLYNLAYVYEKTGDMKAIDYLMACLRVGEKLKDPKIIAMAKSNLSGIYFDIGEKAYGLKLALDAIEMKNKVNDLFGLATSYNNLGNQYHNMRKFDTAYYYYTKSLELRKKVNDKLGMISSLNNVGSIYLAREDYEKAKQYYDEALELCAKMNNELLVAYTNDNLSSLYIRTGDMQKALRHAQITLDIGKKQDLADLKFRGADRLYSIYKIKKDYKKCLEMLELRNSMKEKMSGKEQQRLLFKQQYKLEYEKKETEVRAKAQAEKEKIEAKNREEKRIQNIIIVSVAAGFFLVLILAIVIFRSLQQNREKNRIISEQKKLVEEKNKEMLDSIKYASRIQRSLLPTEKYMERNLNK